MKWHSDSLADTDKRLLKWHRYFAWVPVYCWATKKTVWFEFVERKVENYSNYLQEFDFVYREIKEPK